MIKYFFIILLSIASITFAQDEVVESTAASVPERNLDVAIGIDEIIKFDYSFNTKVQIGNESLLNLVLSPSKQEITFKGVKAGKTSVTIRDQAGDIRDRFIVTITSDGNSNIVSQLRDLIGDVEGLEIGIKGGRVFVGGEIVVPSDIGRVSTVLAGYPDVLLLLELSDQTQRVIARKMQEELAKNNLRDVTVRVVNKTFWLEGVVNAQAKKELAMEIANAYLPDRIKALASDSGRIESVKRDPILNFISVNEQKDPPQPKKLLKIATQFVELSKNYNNSFGFRWAPFMTNEGSISFGQTDGGEINSSQDGTLAGTITNLFPKLNSAKNAGYARIIQSAMVVTEDKETASVKKNSQYSFAVGSGEFTQAQQVDLTFDFKVKPEVIGEESVKMDLGVTVTIPQGQSGSGTPLTTTNSVSTKVVVKSKESAVIGGIVQNSSSTDYDKGRPNLNAEGGGEAQVTPLFDLYRAKSYGTSKSQFVVFVTPEIIQSAAEGTEEVRKKFRKRVR